MPRMTRPSAPPGRRTSSRRRLTSPRWRSTPAARALGAVAASLRRVGREPAARAYDALIAATAVAEGLPIFTCNPGDFAALTASMSSPLTTIPTIEVLGRETISAPRARRSVARLCASRGRSGPGPSQLLCETSWSWLRNDASHRKVFGVVFEQRAAGARVPRRGCRRSLMVSLGTVAGCGGECQSRTTAPRR